MGRLYRVESKTLQLHFPDQIPTNISSFIPRPPLQTLCCSSKYHLKHLSVPRGQAGNISARNTFNEECGPMKTGSATRSFSFFLFFERNQKCIGFFFFFKENCLICNHMQLIQNFRIYYGPMKKMCRPDSGLTCHSCPEPAHTVPVHIRPEALQGQFPHLTHSGLQHGLGIWAE